MVSLASQAQKGRPRALKPLNHYYNPYPYVSDIGCDEKASHGLGSDDVVYLGTVGKDSKRHNNKIAADW